MPGSIGTPGSRRTSSLGSGRACARCCRPGSRTERRFRGSGIGLGALASKLLDGDRERGAQRGAFSRRASEGEFATQCL